MRAFQNDTHRLPTTATTKDMITSSPGAEEQYEGFRRVGGGEITTSIGLAAPNVASSVSTFPANNYSAAEQQDPSQLVQDIISHNSHYNGQNGSMDDPYYDSHEFESAARDATANIHNMHSKLLYLLSHPELFHEALSWEDQSLSAEANDKFEEDSTFEGLSDTNVKATQNETFEFNPNANGDQGGGGDNKQSNENDADNNSPPLPFDIFAADAEVVLPQALTATQLFGVERETGIELEAAAGITGLSHLFLRWLALMPEGDHMNVIRPPGLTVMRIAGGGYRVTAAHRVVWRWMNKFSFSPLGSSGETVDGAAAASAVDDTDFDFGDLVTMTIIDVFETDVDGRLLSYCPTFDNRAVHKTQESIERIRKGASQFKERMEVVAKTPAGQSAAHAAEDLRKKGLSAAFKGFNLVKNRIENEIHKHQHPKSPGNNAETAAASTASSDAVGGEDIGDEASEREEASPEGGRGVEV